MIKDIVKIKALDTCFESIEVYSLHGTSVDIVAKMHGANFVVISSFTIEQVDAYLITIKREVEILTIVATAKVGEVDGVAKEYPLPANIRTNLIRWFGSKINGLSALANKFVALEGVGVLKHSGEIILLLLDIISIYTRKILQLIMQTTQKPLLLFTADIGKISAGAGKLSTIEIVATLSVALPKSWCAKTENGKHTNKNNKQRRTEYFFINN